MQKFYQRRVNRRAFVGMAATLFAGGLLLRSGGDPSCAAASVQAAEAKKHNVWVWRFDVDGPPDGVRNVLSQHGLGIILKTHEGDSWMSSFDKTGTAIYGPHKVWEMAQYFESAGVPFHAWCVVQGKNPMVEAQICSEVLNAGARSMTFDLEPSDGGHYWQGTRESALAFGQELRRLQPNAHLAVAPDGRPWQIKAVPTAEFATFCNEVMPQTYWQTFNGKTNNRLMGESGFVVGPEGMTPELILDASASALRDFGLPIQPIGQGTAGGAEWGRFVNHAYALGMESVSVWRYGTANAEVWPTLQALAPAQPPTPVPATETPPPTETPTQEPSSTATPEATATASPEAEVAGSTADSSTDTALDTPEPNKAGEACASGG
jgi:hypothetical protein